ncbi:MAG TPA: histidine kinase [Cyclobacteriaceae bacterium]|jgi:two-component system LytT family sensor kinase|nr:histidine kinase [Cytophagales bacterium]HNT50252.1 histidine kinase [Cyclobacteriaceae bacterium]HRE65560.1 histidine kinase [Cyclobacteriaceae bacterium]HRF32522.1 histidine kinase [Cyclobacteriaceae bacterium]
MSAFFRYRFDHIIFWILTVFFHGYTRMPWINKAGWNQFVLELIVRNALLACAVYLVIGLSLPRFTSGNKKWLGLLWFIVAISVYVAGKNAHDVYFYGYVLGDSSRINFFLNSFYNLSIVLFYVGFASTLYLTKQWYLQREQMRKIEMEKLNTELEYLRAQINPHFLFNSINTIYFQIDKQNQQARNTLEKFSEMLRYQLYDCSGNQIEIEKEVNYLRNYIELQKLRFGNQYEVGVSVGENMHGFTIPPLLLIPFVENAFKHVSHFTDKINKINVELSRLNDQLIFSIANTVEPKAIKQEGGIGIKNVTRRLELLYNHRHSLKIERDSSVYTVTLQIPVL